MRSDQRAPAPRSATLDILRLIAVLLVLGRHMETYPLEFGKGFTFFASRLWQNGGWTGVDLFFVLSGFLIGGLLFAEAKKTNRIRVGRFLYRRGMKIYPAYYVLFLATIAFKLAFHQPMRLRAVLAEAFFLQNYLGGLWNHTWSLTVEEHFYLGLPLLFLVLLRIGKRSKDPFRWTPWIAGFAVVACLSMRLAVSDLRPYLLGPTHLRLDSLLIGVAVAYLYHFHQDQLLTWSRRWQLPLFVCGVALFLPPFYFAVGGKWWVHSVGPTGFAIGSAMILTSLLDREPRPTRLIRFGAFLGSRSYSIYLWHSAIALATAKFWTSRLMAFGAAGWYLYFAAYMLGSFCFGLLMASAIEFPILRLRDRMKPAPVSAIDSLPTGI